jgi:hypothetical protein
MYNKVEIGGFEVLREVTLKSPIYRGVTPCSSIKTSAPHRVVIIDLKID